MAVRRSSFQDLAARQGRGYRAAAVLLIGFFVLAMNLVLLYKASYPVKRTNAATAAERTFIGTEGEISVGRPDAPVVIDYYYDYHCGPCQQLDASLIESIRETRRTGRVLLNYHPLTLHDKDTVREKYASRAAGAAYCVAQRSPAAFENYHRRLLSMQPAQGSYGHTNKWLAAEGQRAQATSSLLDCITKDTYESFAQGMTTKFLTEIYDRTVPEIHVNGRIIPTSTSTEQLKKRIELESVGWSPTPYVTPSEVEVPTVDPSEDVKMPWMEQPKSIGRQIGDL